VLPAFVAFVLFYEDVAIGVCGAPACQGSAAPAVRQRPRRVDGRPRVAQRGGREGMRRERAFGAGRAMKGGKARSGCLAFPLYPSAWMVQHSAPAVDDTGSAGAPKARRRPQWEGD